MDSTEQSQVIENSTEQPENITTAESSEGQKVDYEKQYKELQAEYTRLRQSQSVQETEVDDDKADLIRTLKEDYGLMTKEDYDNIESKKSRLANLDQVLSDRPELKGLKNAIKAIGENSDESWEKIISDNFSDVPLAAENPGIVGNSNIPKREEEGKKLSDMSREEFARYKREIGIDNPFKKR